MQRGAHAVAAAAAAPIITAPAPPPHIHTFPRCCLTPTFTTHPPPNLPHPLQHRSLMMLLQLDPFSVTSPAARLVIFCFGFLALLCVSTYTANLVGG